MKDRPIIFNDAMIRAILAGRKTQTRRVIKPQPVHIDGDVYEWKDGLFALEKCPTNTALLNHCPYGRPGDRLWVRETRAKNYPAVYRADVAEDFYHSYLWTPSIHMPRHASRITLEVTGVRVERVQDITEEDAMAEGARPTIEFCDNLPCGYGSAIPEFNEIWDSCYPDAADAWKRWNANPYVWCIEFKRVQP